MNQSDLRKLAVSIAIVSLMLSASILTQASATTIVGGMIEKSLTMTAGADGRAFAVVNGTYMFPATQRIDYSNSFELYSIYTDNSFDSASYTGIGPYFGLPSSTFDPILYSTGPLSSDFLVPTFLMTHNTTNNVVSPTITLSAKDNITLTLGQTSECQVDALNVVAAAFGVSAGQQNKLLAFTGLVTGGAISGELWDPDSNFVSSLYSGAGYFAFPFLANKQGYYTIYISSATSSYVKITPIEVPTTNVAMGQFATGEIKIPSNLSIDWSVKRDYQPSQIVALSYDVSAGSEYAFVFSANEELVSPATSSFTCMYFDVGTRKDGTAMFDTLTTSTTPVEPLVSRAPINGKVYIVLVGNWPSRLMYSMGVESTTVPTAPFNEPFYVELANPSGNSRHRMLYKFSLTADSMVRLNRTGYSGTIYSVIYKFGSDGTVYSTIRRALGHPNSWIRNGLAETNLQYFLYMGRGDYMLAFDATSNSHATIEINTYPISNYSFGSPFNVNVHTTKAFAINITNALQYYAFNVTLLSQLNASITYQIALYDDYNRFLNSFSADGSDPNRGIGNRQNNGAWQGVANGQYYVDPGPATQLYFNGNKSLQQCTFVSSHAGTYYLIIDVTNGYDTTNTGTDNAHRWTYYTGLTASLKMDLSGVDPTVPPLSATEIKYISLDSSSGTGSTSIVLTGTGGSTYRIIALALTGKVNTWTMISVSITNGTSSRILANYELLYDRIRYLGSNTFDYDYVQQLWPAYAEVGTTLRNATYQIEFGDLMPTTMIQFRVNVPATAAHTVVTFIVNHYNTTAFSGLTIPPSALAGPTTVFPLEVLFIVVVIVAAALIVVFIVVKKKKPT
nr:hypothetical protein [Candidatus Njordarchaeota archaeon]